MPDRPRVILSGFADEAANQKTAVQQFAAFAALGLQYYSIRFIDGAGEIKNVMQLTIPEIHMSIPAKMRSFKWRSFKIFLSTTLALSIMKTGSGFPIPKGAIASIASASSYRGAGISAFGTGSFPFSSDG